MDFAAALQQAWRLTWRRPFVWLLALLAGAPISTCSGLPGNNASIDTETGGPLDDDEPWRDDVREWRADGGDWLGDHLALVVALILIALALWLAFLLISAMAQGAVTRACADLHDDQPASLGRAWRAGVARIWVNLRLTLLWLVVNLAVGALALLSFVNVIFRPDAESLGLLALVGLVLLLLSIPASVLITYARFGVNLEDTGAWPALQRGYDLLRGQLGPSLLAWLVLFAVTLAGSIAIGIVVALAIGVLVAVGAGVYFGLGTAATVVYGSVAGAVFLAGALVLAGAFSAFVWHFWTRVYLHLHGKERTRRAGLTV